MSQYRSMNDFRSALSDLVEDTGSRKKRSRQPTKKRPTKKRRARQNMAVRRLPGGGYEADEPEELARYERARDLLASEVDPFAEDAWGAPPTRAPRKAGRRKAPTRSRVSSRGQKKGLGRTKVQTRDYGPPPKPFDPVSAGKAKVIGLSVGGLAKVCPAFVGQRIEGGAYATALRAAGLQEGEAHIVIQTMAEHGVLRSHRGEETTKAQQALALKILLDLGGITCPIDPARPNSNEKKRRGRR